MTKAANTTAANTNAAAQGANPAADAAKQDKILDRIRKLLAMAGDGAKDSEHERKVALERAQKLMIQHNITMTQVNGEFARSGDSIEVKAGPWFRRVAQAASILFFCFMHYEKVEGTQRYRVTFTGRKDNVETAIEMTQYLIKGIRKGYNEFKKVAGEDNRLKTNFRNAAANALVIRAVEMRQSASDADIHVAELYQGEETRNQEAALKNAGIAKFSEGSMKTSITKANAAEEAATMAGVKCGRTISVHKQVAAPAQAEAVTA